MTESRLDVEVSSVSQPERCRLCNASAGISAAGFRQVYRQVESATLYLRWWSCSQCKGWFVYPVPTREEIIRNCSRATYNDPARAGDIAKAKQSLQERILAQASEWRRPGPLLDFGCSFGEFLVVARDAGWIPSGFDAHDLAVKTASGRGFDVRAGWELYEAGFPEKNFAAITAVDSFYYTWNPYETLRLFYRLLEPGGVLAMRLSNKRTVAGMVRALSPAGPTRDMHVSRILQGQFHAVSVTRLTSILRQIGFDRIQIDPRAQTLSWRGMSFAARLAYLTAQMLYTITIGRLHLSPGVLLFAQKPA